MKEENILVIDRNELLGGLYAERIQLLGRGRFSSTVAMTAETAREVFHGNRGNISAIITTGWLGPNRGVSVAYELVREFRTAGFTGPIVANSSDDRMNNELRKAGATTTSPSKDRAVETCLNLLLHALLPQ